MNTAKTYSGVHRSDLCGRLGVTRLVQPQPNASEPDSGVCFMQPEFSQFVDDAANVKVSGRWDAMNTKIQRLAAKPGVGNEWYVQLFGALCYQVFSEYHQLEKAYKGRENAPL